MAGLDLRPLSLGEILDRTFSLYRRHFLLFLGITAIPQLLILALNLTQTLLTKMPAVPESAPVEQFQSAASGGMMAFGIVGVLVGLVIYFVAYLFAQGGTVFAVSELYLGRTTTIGASLGRMRGQLGSLLGVLLLNGLAIMGAALFLLPVDARIRWPCLCYFSPLWHSPVRGHSAVHVPFPHCRRPGRERSGDDALLAGLEPGREFSGRGSRGPVSHHCHRRVLLRSARAQGSFRLAIHDEPRRRGIVWKSQRSEHVVLNSAGDRNASPHRCR